MNKTQSLNVNVASFSPIHRQHLSTIQEIQEEHRLPTRTTENREKLLTSTDSQNDPSHAFDKIPSSRQCRRVQFAMKPDEKEASVSPHHCYWGSSEIAQIQENARLVAAEYARKRPDYVESVEILFDTSTLQTQQECRQETQERSTAAVSLLRKKTKAVVILSKSNARGLEQLISPLLRAHRRWGVRKVLDLQNKLRKKRTRHPEKVAALLKARSLEISRRSRLFALKLADGDAVQAGKHCHHAAEQIAASNKTVLLRRE